MIAPMPGNPAHPPTPPYFKEFAPLFGAGGGVNLYRKEFAFDYFIPTHGLLGDLSVHERDYLDSLIQHALKRGKRPVITFNRSLGRIAALQKELSGYHIVNVRNIFEQWTSALSFADKGNDYFLRVVQETICQNRTKDRFLDILGASTIHCERTEFAGFANYQSCYIAFFCFIFTSLCFAKKHGSRARG